MGRNMPMITINWCCRSQLLQERFGDKLRLDRRVETAKRFIDENYGRKITVSQLASISHLSPRQLNELFREQVGLTPHHYLTELRMQSSWQLLEQGELSIQKKRIKKKGKKKKK